MVTYPNARDESGYDVNIKDVTPAMKASTQFYCWGCGKRMVAVTNGEVQPHFRHYEECECNGETYIHNRGKAVFKETFDKSQDFYAEMKGVSICSHKYECPLFNSERCVLPKSFKFNLKEYYDASEFEVYIKEYNVQPDVLLTSSTYPERKLFVEIYHTSECTSEKIAMGERIIEIRVNSESDIKTIQSGMIKESEHIRFYNFHPKETVPHNREQAILFYVTENGRVGFDINDCSDYFPREKVDLGSLRYGIFANYSSLSSQKDFIRFCISKAYDERKLYRDCRMCKHLDCLGGDNGFDFWEANCSSLDDRIPPGTMPDRAIQCPCFEFDLNNAGLCDVFQEFDRYAEYLPEIDKHFHDRCDSEAGEQSLMELSNEMLFAPGEFSDEQKKYIDSLFRLFDEEGNIRLPHEYVTQAYALAEKRNMRIVTCIADNQGKNKFGYWKRLGLNIELKLKLQH